MYKDYRFINAGMLEIYRWGRKCEERLLSCKVPNKNGYLSIPTDAGPYWTIGTSTGKYGEFARIDDMYFSVNSRGYIYAKVGTEKEKQLRKVIDIMHERILFIREDKRIMDYYRDFWKGRCSEEDLIENDIPIPDEDLLEELFGEC